MFFKIVIITTSNRSSHGWISILDLGLANDGFSDSIWASYIMFIDIGTQTAMATTDEGLTLLIAAFISCSGRDSKIQRNLYSVSSWTSCVRFLISMNLIMLV